jgi:hypothetical protein
MVLCGSRRRRPAGWGAELVAVAVPCQAQHAGVQAVIWAMRQNPRKGVTHTRDEMLPLEHVYVTPLKTTRKIAANTTIRPMVPKATGFDALRDSTLRTPYFSCASKYLA